MWLDRLAGQQVGTVSPQSNSRPISPLPRRTSSARGPYLTSQRTNSTPKGSSLSLVSSDSSSSLLASSRRVNGSGLRQSTTAAVDDHDAEEVLEALLGPPPDGTAVGDKPRSSITREDLNLEFDFGGRSLRELALDDGSTTDGESVYRAQSIEECMFAFLAFPHSYGRLLVLKLLSTKRRTRQGQVRGAAPVNPSLRRHPELRRDQPHELPKRPGHGVSRYRDTAG